MRVRILFTLLVPMLLAGCYCAPGPGQSIQAGPYVEGCFGAIGRDEKI